jgi:hypothetical protein
MNEEGTLQRRGEKIQASGAPRKERVLEHDGDVVLTQRACEVS